MLVRESSIIGRRPHALCIGDCAAYHVCVDAVESSHLIKRLAVDVGFDRCGIAQADRIGRAGYLRRWLDGGRAGSMHYLHRYFDKRVDPRALLPGSRSVIMVAKQYHQAPAGSRGMAELDGPPETIDRSQGRVARYAWGDDYHQVLKAKLFSLADRLRGELSEPFKVKACVDTVPLLEREWAAASGLGWIGKNTLVLRAEMGSYFFLGGLVTTLDLAADAPALDHCGTCTACLDACPTDAFPAPYEMDATRCISYLTIEHRGDINESLQPKMDDWIFGCDICQDVCPYNRNALLTDEPRFAIRDPGPAPALDEILEWTPDDYRARLRGSAIKRATLDMLQRNARIARSNKARSKAAADSLR